MGRRDLPDMNTRARGECGLIRQILTAHVTYDMLCNTSGTLKKSAELTLNFTAPLYNDGHC